MPTYEYLCQKCEREFEVEQRITDDPIKSCPHCRSRKVKRLISRTSFVLKGGGWYSDLYSSGGSKKADDAGASSSESSKSAEGGSASEASKEASPAKESSPSDSSSKDSGSKGKAEGEGKGAGKKRPSKGAKAAA